MNDELARLKQLHAQGELTDEMYQKLVSQLRGQTIQTESGAIALGDHNKAAGQQSVIAEKVGGELSLAAVFIVSTEPGMGQATT